MKTFKQSCNKPYDRHDYKLVLSDGTEIIFDDYEDVRVTWFQTANQFLDYVEVLDKKLKSKGFK